jgi:hypothetical protein
MYIQYQTKSRITKHIGETFRKPKINKGHQILHRKIQHGEDKTG